MIPQTPLSRALYRQTQFLALRLRPGSAYHYTVTARNFLRYLHQNFPGIRRADQLRRDPHLLGWMEQLASRQPPLSISRRSQLLLLLRRLLEDLDRPGLLRSEDIPRADLRLPRPLSPEDDALLQQQLRATDDLLSNALLLLRATGLRIGELVDLSVDCLQHVEGDHWALRVPLGKLHTERWVPLDSDARDFLARLTALRDRVPTPPGDPFLLPRSVGRDWLTRHLRKALAAAAQAAGCSRRFVPHQLRHTCATEWLRRGVSLPGVMKLLGHTTPAMTMFYVQVTQTDLQRELLRATQTSPHTLPLPAAISSVHSFLDALRWSLHLLDAQRTASPSKKLDPFRRRLLRLLDLAQKLFA
jgi:site-specific recombinase XerD